MRQIFTHIRTAVPSSGSVISGRLRNAAAMALFLSIIAASANAQDGWQWFRTQPISRGAGWQSSSGIAVVTFTKNRFIATLYDRSFAAYRIEGFVKGERVKATEIELNTDASALNYSGTIERTHTAPSDPSHGWGEDRIALTSGPWFVGLYFLYRPNVECFV